MNFKGRGIAYQPQGSFVRHSDPSPDEITALCESIQDGWTEREKLSRQHFQLGPVRVAGMCSMRRPHESELPQGVEIRVIPVREIVEAA